MSVSRMKNLTPIGVEQMGDLADSLRDPDALGLGAAAAWRLLEIGNVAATPIADWGSASTARYLRILYANERLERLEGIGRRFRAALG